MGQVKINPCLSAMSEKHLCGTSPLGPVREFMLACVPYSVCLYGRNVFCGSLDVWTLNKEQPWLNSLWSVSRKHAIPFFYNVMKGKKKPNKLLGCYFVYVIASSTDWLTFFFFCVLLFCPARQNLNQKHNVWERTYLLKHEIVHLKVLKKLWASNTFWLSIS